MQSDPDMQDVFVEVPSAKVATIAAYQRHLQHRMQHLQLCLNHFCTKQYRALRWDTYRKRQAALANMCNVIRGNRKDAIVGYGDGSFSSTGPTTSLRRRLRSMCHVYDVDEFRTSKLCSACHHPMAGMRSGPQGETSSYLNVRHPLLCQFAAGYHNMTAWTRLVLLLENPCVCQQGLH